MPVGRSKWRCALGVGAVTWMLSSVATAEPAEPDAVEIRLQKHRAVIEVIRNVAKGGPTEVLFSPGVVAVGLDAWLPNGDSGQWLTGNLVARSAQGTHDLDTLQRGDLARLTWMAQGKFALRVSEARTVAYRFALPMHYQLGRHWLELDPLPRLAAGEKVMVRADSGVLFVDGRAVDSPSFIDPARSHRLEQSSVASEIEGELGAMAISDSQAFVSYRFDLPPRLSSIPDSARVIVILDTSLSMGGDGVEGARAAAAAFAGHWDGSDAGVSVLSYSRKVKHLTQGFVDGARAQATIQNANLELGNGSEMKEALEEAARLLKDASPEAARRILLLTDLHTKKALDPLELRRLLPARTVLHVATIKKGSPQLQRVDANKRWAGLPRATGGLLWLATTDTEDNGADERSNVFEEWARPVRIDNVRLLGDGVNSLWNGVLREGEGFEQEEMGSKRIESVDLVGELWATQIGKSLTLSGSYTKARAALAIGILGDSLQPDELLALARAGEAVSSMTGFVVRNSRGTQAARNLVSQVYRSSRTPSVRQGSGSGSSGRPIYDYVELLKATVLPIAAACGVVVPTNIDVESTLSEIVAVEVAPRFARPLETSKRDCLVEGIWAARLPKAFQFVAARNTRFTLAWP